MTPEYSQFASAPDFQEGPTTLSEATIARNAAITARIQLRKQNRLRNNDKACTIEESLSAATRQTAASHRDLPLGGRTRSRLVCMTTTQLIEAWSVRYDQAQDQLRDLTWQRTHRTFSPLATEIVLDNLRNTQSECELARESLSKYEKDRGSLLELGRMLADNPQVDIKNRPVLCRLDDDGHVVADSADELSEARAKALRSVYPEWLVKQAQNNGVSCSLYKFMRAKAVAKVQRQRETKTGVDLSHRTS